MKREFSPQISENVQISNFMKTIQREPSSMRTDGRTDTTKVTVAFRNFTKAPDNIHIIKLYI